MTHPADPLAPSVRTLTSRGAVASSILLTLVALRAETSVGTRAWW